MSKLLQGEELERRCIALGISIEGPPRTQSTCGNSPRASDVELQRRLLEVERSVRESCSRLYPHWCRFSAQRLL
jgi:hypothetical protein